MPATCGAVSSRPCTCGIGAEQRRPVPGRQPRGQRDPEAAQQRGEVVAPRDRHGDVADRVLEDQIPADDPGDQLAERRVRVGVGAPGLRDHRGQLRVAQRRERAHRAQQQEREHQRGPRAQATTSPSGPTCPAAAVPIAPKMPAPITAPIASIDQIAGAEHALQRVRPDQRRRAVRRSACGRKRCDICWLACRLPDSRRGSVLQPKPFRAIDRVVRGRPTKPPDGSNATPTSSVPATTTPARRPAREPVEAARRRPARR